MQNILLVWCQRSNELYDHFILTWVFLPCKKKLFLCKSDSLSIFNMRAPIFSYRRINQTEEKKHINIRLQPWKLSFQGIIVHGQSISFQYVLFSSIIKCIYRWHRISRLEIKPENLRPRFSRWRNSGGNLHVTRVFP